ncbi:MAG: class I SAM-dependent methyltransferase [DPANN group archaeon]|nr:class I SAM-dependent methyltransferase [DPANN group archaeon]
MDIEYVNCNLCGKDDTTFVTKTVQDGQEFKLVKCASCDLIYLNPRLTWDTIKGIYSENKLDNFQYYLNTKDLDEQTFTERLNLIRQYTTPGKVLDIGSSIGIFLHAAHKQGWQIFGMELNKEEAKYSEENFGVKLVSSYGTKPKFDLINMSDVIEHFTHPKEELQKISKALKQNGLLLISTPDFDNKLTRKVAIKPHEHLYYFDKTTLTKLLEDTGFKVLYIESTTRKLSLKTLRYSSSFNTSKVKKFILDIIVYTKTYKIFDFFVNKTNPDLLVIAQKIL